MSLLFFPNVFIFPPKYERITQLCAHGVHDVIRSKISTNLSYHDAMCAEKLTRKETCGLNLKNGFNSITNIIVTRHLI